MPVTIVHPGNESVPKAATPPARLASLTGKKIGLLDISKPGGSFFLDRLEEILRTKYGAAEILRTQEADVFQECAASRSSNNCAAWTRWWKGWRIEGRAQRAVCTTRSA